MKPFPSLLVGFEFVLEIGAEFAWCVLERVDARFFRAAGGKCLESRRHHLAEFPQLLSALYVDPAPDAPWSARSEPLSVAVYVKASSQSINPAEAESFIQRFVVSNATFAGFLFVEAKPLLGNLVVVSLEPMPAFHGCFEELDFHWLMIANWQLAIGNRQSKMRVGLFVTCLVDQLWPTIGASTVEVLRRVGCTVDFDERQTCCGQPAFNTGYAAEARKLAKRFIEICEESRSEAIVSPSGSCTAMVHHYPALFPDDEEWRRRARNLAARTFELSAFLIRVLKVEDVGARWPGRLTWHDACHALRDLKVQSEPRRLIQHVREAEFVELENADACCGFGGTFSVKYPEISVAILDQKIEAIEKANVQAVVSGDASCLMQIGGRLSRKGSGVRVMHLAELLALR